MSETPKIEVKIFNKTYRLKCPDNQKEQLLESASYLSTQMVELKTINNSIATDEIAIIAALNVVGELLECRQKQADLDNLSDTLTDIQNNINTSL
jgi:cell division protein ZapA